MIKITAIILLMTLTIPLAGQNRPYIHSSRDYRYKQYDKDRKAENERLKRSRAINEKKKAQKRDEGQIVIGIFGAGGIAGSGSEVVYDPNLPNQTVEYGIAASYSGGIFINLYQGWVTEFSYNNHEVKHSWYDNYGHINYKTPITTYGITTGYKLTWPGFYAVNRGAGYYPFIMAGLGAHITNTRPEVERKMKLNSSADDLDLDLYYSNRYKVKMKRLQGSVTGSIGNEIVLSRHVSIGIGIRGTYYLYLYQNSNAEKILVPQPGDGEDDRDYGDFSEITPITVQLFITVSFMY